MFFYEKRYFGFKAYFPKINKPFPAKCKITNVKNL